MLDSGKTKKDLILGVSAVLIISISILVGSVVFSLSGKFTDGIIAGSVIAVVSSVVLLSGDLY